MSPPPPAPQQKLSAADQSEIDRMRASGVSIPSLGTNDELKNMAADIIGDDLPLTPFDNGGK